VTGAINWIEKVTSKPVIRGIMLGLGLSFILEGLVMMEIQPLLAIWQDWFFITAFNAAGSKCSETILSSQRLFTPLESPAACPV
jgi:hypothetical protein